MSIVDIFYKRAQSRNFWEDPIYLSLREKQTRDLGHKNASASFSWHPDLGRIMVNKDSDYTTERSKRLENYKNADEVCEDYVREYYGNDMANFLRFANERCYMNSPNVVQMSMPDIAVTWAHNTRKQLPESLLQLVLGDDAARHRYKTIFGPEAVGEPFPDPTVGPRRQTEYPFRMIDENGEVIRNGPYDDDEVQQ